MTSNTFRPLRSALYLPAHNQRAIEKSRTLAADAVIFDLEDAVAPDLKAAARANLVVAFGSSGAAGHALSSHSRERAGLPVPRDGLTRLNSRLDCYRRPVKGLTGPVGRPSNCASESVISCHEALLPTKTWQRGRVPGSSSSAPSASPKTRGFASNLVIRFEPQTEQKPLCSPGDDS